MHYNTVCRSLCYLFSALSSSVCGRMWSVTVVTPLGGNVTSVGVRRQEPHNITYVSALCTRHSCHGSSGKVRVK